MNLKRLEFVIAQLERPADKKQSPGERLATIEEGLAYLLRQNLLERLARGVV